MISDFNQALSEDNIIEDSGVQLTDMYKEALANYIHTSHSKMSREESKHSKAAFEPKQMSLSEYRKHRKQQESNKKADNG